MRLDDTNPSAEKTEYAEAIQRDVKWLGFDWEERLFHASDYFDQLLSGRFNSLKKRRLLYVTLLFEEMREYRGTLIEPGKNSPYRDRSVAENLDLFQKMKQGEFEDGSKTFAGQDRYEFTQFKSSGSGDLSNHES